MKNFTPFMSVFPIKAKQKYKPSDIQEYPELICRLAAAGGRREAPVRRNSLLDGGARPVHRGKHEIRRASIRPPWA